MSKIEPRDELVAPLRTMQIIWAALISGVALFLVITLLVRSDPGPIIVRKELLDYSSMLVLSGVLGALLCVLAFFTVPALVVTSQRQALASGHIDQVLKRADGPRTEPAALAAIYQTQLIIGLALLEGAAFVNAIVFMLEGSAVSLGTALVLLALMATRVPTRRRLDEWVADQRRLLRDESDAPPAA